MLRERLASSLAGIAIILLVLKFGGVYGWAALVAVAAAIGFVEFYRFSGQNARPPVVFGCLWVVLVVLSPLATPAPDQTGVAVLGGGMVASLAWLMARRGKDDSLPTFLWMLAGILYVGWLARYFVALRGITQGGDWVAFALFTTFSVDTSAFFIGRWWGRHKLAPLVSPNKTKEGAVAGLAGGMAASMALTALLDLPLSAWQSLLLGFLVAVFAQFGDLAESMLKRNAGVKDSGRFLPGHGGLLDRADSILLSGIVVYYYVLLI
ncbi:MAG: phosphatidate cytidylyltransferase [Chloroflexi bacterium]|nr:phosphatidate cytidylyltransferase [Chloroflexota bacterium]